MSRDNNMHNCDHLDRFLTDIRRLGSSLNITDPDRYRVARNLRLHLERESREGYLCINTFWKVLSDVDRRLCDILLSNDHTYSLKLCFLFALEELMEILPLGRGGVSCTNESLIYANERIFTILSCLKNLLHIEAFSLPQTISKTSSILSPSGSSLIHHHHHGASLALPPADYHLRESVCIKAVQVISHIIRVAYTSSSNDKTRSEVLKFVTGEFVNCVEVILSGNASLSNALTDQGMYKLVDRARITACIAVRELVSFVNSLDLSILVPVKESLYDFISATCVMLIPASLEVEHLAISINHREEVASVLSVILVTLYRIDAMLNQDDNFNKMITDLVCLVTSGLASSFNTPIQGSLLVLNECLLIDPFGSYLRERLVDIYPQVEMLLSHDDVSIRGFVVLILLPSLCANDAAYFLFQTQIINLLVSHILQTEHLVGTFSVLGRIANLVGPEDFYECGLQVLKLAENYLIDKKVPKIPAHLYSVDGKHPSKRKIRKLAVQDALDCITQIASIYGAEIEPHVESLFDYLFSTGLSESLIDSLSHLAANIPSLLPQIRERLLNSIGGLLGSSASKNLETHTSSGTEDTSGMDESGPEGGGIPRSQSHEHEYNQRIALALIVLREIGVDEAEVAKTVNIILRYLEHCDPVIRRNSALLLIKILPCNFVSGEKVCKTHQILSVAHVVSQIVSMAITDIDIDNRYLILLALNKPKFDFFLCEESCAQRLSIALRDERLEVRKVALEIIGRLAHHNSAVLLPCLRDLLFNQLTKLDSWKNFESSSAQQLHKFPSSSGLHSDGKHPQTPKVPPSPAGANTATSGNVDIQAASSLLSILVRTTGDILTVYMGIVTHAVTRLILHARGLEPETTSKLLDLFAEIAEVDREPVLKVVSGIINFISQFIIDDSRLTGGRSRTYSSGIKINCQLKTTCYRILGRLVERCNLSILPLEVHPELLASMESDIRFYGLQGLRQRFPSNQEHEMFINQSDDFISRNQLIRTIGIFGAVSPQKYAKLVDKQNPSLATDDTSPPSKNLRDVWLHSDLALKSLDSFSGMNKALGRLVLIGSIEGLHSRPIAWICICHSMAVLVGMLTSPLFNAHRVLIINPIEKIFHTVDKYYCGQIELQAPLTRNARTFSESTCSELELMDHAPEHSQREDSPIGEKRPPENPLLVFVPYVIGEVLQFVRDVNSIGYHGQERLIKFLIETVNVCKSNIQLFASKILQTVPTTWPKFIGDSPDSWTRLVILHLELLEALSRYANSDFIAHMTDGTNQISLILETLYIDSTTGGEMKVSIKTIATLSSVGKSLDTDQHLARIIPCLVHIASQTLDEETCVDDLIADPPITTTNSEYYREFAVDPIRSAITELRVRAIFALRELCPLIKFGQFAGTVIHPLLRILDSNAQLKCISDAIILTFEHFHDLYDEFAVYAPAIKRIYEDRNLSNPNLDMLHQPVFRQPDVLNLTDDVVSFDQSFLTSYGEHNKQPRNRRTSWNIPSDRLPTREEWTVWFTEFTTELLRESESPSIRACWPLTQIYENINFDLLHASFLTYWVCLSDESQCQLVQTLETVLEAPRLPPNITHSLLSMIEFMDRCGIVLPIDCKKLSIISERSHSYARALYYREVEFRSYPSSQCVDALMTINMRIGQNASANGVLTYARKFLKNTQLLSEDWYEKLHCWDSALEVYELKSLQDVTNKDYIIGRMRCLKALSDWDRLADLCELTWEQLGMNVHCINSGDYNQYGGGASLSSISHSLNVVPNDKPHRYIASLGVLAEFSRQNYEGMVKYVDYLRFIVEATDLYSRSSFDASFYSAVLSIHDGDYSSAYQNIRRSRQCLDSELITVIPQSYARAYNCYVKAQQLTELEEIAKIKQLPEGHIMTQQLKEAWVSRLNSCRRDVATWEDIYRVRTMAFSPIYDGDVILKFVSLCRKYGHLSLCFRALGTLKSASDLLPVTLRLKIEFAYIKSRYDANYTREARGMLEDDFLPKCKSAGLESSHLLAKCYLLLGQWTKEIFESTRNVPFYTDASVFEEVCNYQNASIKEDDNYHKGWQAWALTNYSMAQYLDTSLGSSILASGGVTMRRSNLPPAQGCVESRKIYVREALRGLIKSAIMEHATNQNNPLTASYDPQNVLRFLTLWFRNAGDSEIDNQVSLAFSLVPVEAWLPVIPQIIARLRSTNSSLQRLVEILLVKIGRTFPQSLLFPLTAVVKGNTGIVPSGSSSNSLAEATAITIATNVLFEISKDYPTLVAQADLVATELIRISITWPELWCETFEVASKMFFEENDADGMILTLLAAHELITRPGPSTPREVAFLQAYEKDLNEALMYLEQFRTSRMRTDSDRAWAQYFKVFQKIVKQNQQLKKLDLKTASPILLNATNLEIAVPGTKIHPTTGKPIVTIASFQQEIEIVTSKQRPRIIVIRGSDGKRYKFLLKGREDLKQDERVMQVFSLINALVCKKFSNSSNNRQHDKRGISSGDESENFEDLLIRTFAVIPISANSGLIEWVPNCDVLHSIITSYREHEGIHVSVEHQAMKTLSSHYEELPILQRLEVFRHGLNQTSGDDLRRVLWIQSVSAEDWLRRRITFIKSLAISSIVGYILGLGDRHPSNIMIDRVSGRIDVTIGKVVHIDFGDCFEVAMQRDKYPEKVPFRLTRILINALEVTGVDGLFRTTCEEILTMIRSNRDSLMAMLEAFVLDPLITWRYTLNQSIHPPHEIDPEEHAKQILMRVRSKLTGREFTNNQQVLSVSEQVDRLIHQATLCENVCECYIGWCPFW